MNRTTNTAYAATIGFFDGVHQGHRYLIDRLMADAAEQGMDSMVVTFDEHPRKVLGSAYQPQLLTTLEEKRRLLLQTGISRCEVLHFDREMAHLSAREFMTEVLADQFHVRRLHIGYDNRFGHRREDTFADYVAYGQEAGIEVLPVPELPGGEGHVSSSRIRQLLLDGDAPMATQGLGRPYFITGTVVSGEQEGRRMGFPTANVQPNSPDKLIPRLGAWAVMVRVDGSQELLPGMMNIGTRPTFGPHATTLEVHIIGLQAQLYGHQLTVEFRQWLRPERAFDSPEALANQLEADRKQCLEILWKTVSEYPPSPSVL